MIDSHILFLAGPLGVLDSAAGYHSLISVDQAIAVILGPCELSLDIDEPLSVSFRVGFFRLLRPSQVLLLNAVEAIYFS